jgi:hypothetical protein
MKAITLDARVEPFGGLIFCHRVRRRAIQRANCYHREGHDAPCSVGGDGYYMLLFGLAQVVLSQIPGFHEMAGLSVFAAVMSFFYAFVGVGLGVAKVIGTCLPGRPPCVFVRRHLICKLSKPPITSANGVIMGGIGGIPMVSTTQKVWRVSQALGDILFAYPFSLVLLEIEVQHARRAPRLCDLVLPADLLVWLLTAIDQSTRTR